MKNKALLRIDMSKDFVCDIYEVAQGVFVKGGLVVPAGKNIIPAIKEITDIARENDIFIADLLDKHDPTDPEFFAPEGPQGKGWPLHNLRSFNGSNTVDELDVSGVRIYPKKSYNGFTNPYLAKDLKNEGIEEVYLTGLVGNICIEATAKGAKDAGFKVFIIKECICYLPDVENNEAKKSAELERLSKIGEII